VLADNHALTMILGDWMAEQRRIEPPGHFRRKSSRPVADLLAGVKLTENFISNPFRIAIDVADTGWRPRNDL